MNLTACTASQIGMTLSIEVTLTDGETTTQDTHTERCMRLLSMHELIEWSNQALKERWGVKCEWYAPDRTAEWIILEAAIGLGDDEGAPEAQVEAKPVKVEIPADLAARLNTWAESQGMDLATAAEMLLTQALDAN